LLAYVTGPNTRAQTAYPAHNRWTLVRSKNSCGLAGIVFQGPRKPLTTLNRAFTCRLLADRRKERDIQEPLRLILRPRTA
jgi:hypothetical protein